MDGQELKKLAKRIVLFEYLCGKKDRYVFNPEGKPVPKIGAVAGEIQNRLANAFKPLDNAKQAIETVTDTASLLRELTQVGVENTGAALNSTGALGGVSDLVKDA